MKHEHWNKREFTKPSDSRRHHQTKEVHPSYPHPENLPRKQLEWTVLRWMELLLQGSAPTWESKYLPRLWNWTYGEETFLPPYGSHWLHDLWYLSWAKSVSSSPVFEDDYQEGWGPVGGGNADLVCDFSYLLSDRIGHLGAVQSYFYAGVIWWLLSCRVM